MEGRVTRRWTRGPVGTSENAQRAAADLAAVIPWLPGPRLHPEREATRSRGCATQAKRSSSARLGERSIRGEITVDHERSEVLDTAVARVCP